MILTALALAAALTSASDDPTPYLVDESGITLPAGVVFADNDHINLELVDGTRINAHLEAKCITRTDAECAGRRHELAQLIGAGHASWEVLGVTPPACVKWVQLSAYNEHHGEGGQEPVCGAAVDPGDPDPDEDPVDPTDPADPTDPVDEGESDPPAVVIFDPPVTPAALVATASDIEIPLAALAFAIVGLGSTVLILRRTPS